MIQILRHLQELHNHFSLEEQKAQKEEDPLGDQVLDCVSVIVSRFTTFVSFCVVVVVVVVCSDPSFWILRNLSHSGLPFLSSHTRLTHGW